MKILGLSAFYHDSAACLVIDGNIVAAAQEERFTRKKHDARFPTHAVAYCLAEAGVVGYDVSAWFGLLAPAGTPSDIVAKLNAEVKQIMANPELGDRLASIELVSSTSEFLEQFIQSEVNRWTPVIKELNIKTN